MAGKGSGGKGEGGSLVLAAHAMVAKLLSNEHSSSDDDKEDDDNERWVEFDGTLEDLRRQRALAQARLNGKGLCAGCRCSACAEPVPHGDMFCSACMEKGKGKGKDTGEDTGQGPGFRQWARRHRRPMRQRRPMPRG